MYTTSIPPQHEEAGGSGWQYQMMAAPGSLMLISKITRSCTSTQRTLNVFCFVGQVSRFGATPSHASSSGHDVDDPYSGFNVQEYVVDPDEAPLPTQQTQQSQQPQATGIVIGARERNAPDRYTPSHYDRPPLPPPRDYTVPAAARRTPKRGRVRGPGQDADQGRGRGHG